MKINIRSYSLYYSRLYQCPFFFKKSIHALQMPFTGGLEVSRGKFCPFLQRTPIYTASTEEEAHMALDTFANKWDKQYPQIAKSWYSNWDNLMIFLGYPEPIRKVIYTTNAVESVNSQLRKVTKNKRVFPNDAAVFKALSNKDRHGAREAVKYN